MLNTSVAGRAFLAGHEGIVPYPYLDSVGVWTIGVGHTAGAGAPAPAKMTKGEAISIAECMAIFARDLAQYEAAVASHITAPLTQPQFDALVSFAYNLGAGALAGSTLRKRLNALDYSGAAAEFPKWNKAGGVANAGLTARRVAERVLFTSGIYGDGRATVYGVTATNRPSAAGAKSIDVLALLDGLEPIATPDLGGATTVTIAPGAKTLARLNCRAEPVSGTILGTFDEGAAIKIAETWHYVRGTDTNGRPVEGWCSGKYIA